MSCEVAVMNKRGVALAADSAVTLISRDGRGEKKKIYHAAEKLFQLSDAPIGILTYDSADIMGVPWETVVKMFGRELGDKRFDSVEQYAQAFFRFIEDSNSLFPESEQIRWFQYVVGDYWERWFAARLEEKLKVGPKATPKRAGVRLSELVNLDIVEWKKCDAIEGIGVEHGQKVVHEYAVQIEELEKQVFGSIHLSAKTKKDLRTIVQFIYTKKSLDPEYPSGVVVAGMGESEPFPAVIRYDIGSIAAGRLGYRKIEECRVRHDDDGRGWVVPFAQKEKINLFYRGILQDLEESIPELSLQCLNEVLGPSAKKLSVKLTEKFTQALSQKLDQVVRENYSDPLLESVSALPRYELAKLAEALVNLTAFQKRMSVEEDESVGGWVDVAVISKGDGFIWVKKRNFKTDVGDSDAVL